MKYPIIALSLTTLLSLPVSSHADNWLPAIGNVGIGTKSPGSLLTISSPNNPLLEFNNGPGYALMSKIPGKWWDLDNPFVIQANSTGDMVMTPILNSPKSGIVIKQNSKVGIGTVNPTAKLDVTDGYFRALDGLNIPPTAGSGLEIVSTGGQSYVHAYNRGTSKYNRLHVNGAPLILNYESGARVGIGVLNPQATLDINGNIVCTALALTSDRNQKTNFQSVDVDKIFEKELQLGIQSWVYTNAPTELHIGPTAQDFSSMFGYGNSDKTISVVDAIGVQFASLQGLNRKLERTLAEKNDQIARLEREMASVKQDFSGLRESVEKLVVEGSASKSKSRRQFADANTQH